MVNPANPYSGSTIFDFFAVLVVRLWGFLSGQIPFSAIATDEVQLCVLSCVAASGALVGTFLVLRRMTMLANALSHTILLGIISAYLIMRLFSQGGELLGTLSIPALIAAALATGIVTTFLTEFLSKVIKLQEDASIGLVFSLLFSIGIVLVTLFSRNVHIGIELVMGNADALQRSDLQGTFVMLLLNIVLFISLFRGFKITTFDSQLARAFGYSPLFFNYVLMVQTSATAIGGFRAVGVLMILAYFVIPTMIARLFTNTLSVLIFLSIGIGVFASILGVALSRHILTLYGIGLSTGGIVVTLLGVSYLLGAGLRGVKFLKILN